MAMKIGSVSQKDFNGISFLAIGDGAATSVKIDLSKPPFLIDLLGVTPASVTVTQVGQSGVSATATLSGSLLQINFSAPIDAGNTDVACQFEYASA